MLWIDPLVRARHLARSAILNWDSWTVGAQTGWSCEMERLPKKYRKVAWINISISLGWQKAKSIREFFHCVVGESNEIDAATFEQDPAIDEMDRGVEPDE